MSESSGWFEIQAFPHDIWMIREPHHAEDVKSYVIEGGRDLAVLDTGMGVGDFAGVVAALSSKDPRVLQTHAHWDHFGASHRFANVLVHPTEADGLRQGREGARLIAAFTAEFTNLEKLPADFNPAAGLTGCEPTGWLQDGDIIDLGNRTLEVIHTPGHSAGGVSFLDRTGRALFVGDLLYLGRMYLFFVDSDVVAFRESLRRVSDVLDAVDLVFPAHGAAPIGPRDVLAVRDAFKEVWYGRSSGTSGELLGYDVTTYEFGDFSFLVMPEVTSPISTD
jgi:glyoxylase-like metal-dependent hydrolase (beta-lactamase superfamily II)